MALRGRARRKLEVLVACEAEEDQLLAAKDAAAADPTPENLAAKRAAMASYAETRAWLRAVAQIADNERVIVANADSADPFQVVEREAAEADNVRLRRDFGPLIKAMEQLAGAAAVVDPPKELPPGSATVTPRPARGRTSFGKGGA